MKTVRKALVLAACAIMLVCATIAGTLAYLTSKAEVKNTFTVGNVSITMDETNVDQKDGEPARDTQNTYKLLPGQSYTKDPIIHVGSDSEECWLFVKVENNITAVEDSTDTIASQLATNGWSEIDLTNHIYAYQSKVQAGDDITVFNHFKVASTATNDALNAIDGKTINVTAYAIQAEGFASAQAAWDAAGTEAAQG